MPSGIYKRTREDLERIKKLRIGKEPWNKNRGGYKLFPNGRSPFSEETRQKMRGLRPQMNGENNPNWKGGIAPERQAFYSSQEWAKVIPIIWSRDNKICQRCKKRYKKGEQFHIHHKVDFKKKELRAEPNNLILLCRKCHYWVHSKNNKNKEFLN